MNEMNTLAELQAKQAALQAQIEAELAASRAQAFKDANELIPDARVQSKRLLPCVNPKDPQAPLRRRQAPRPTQGQATGDCSVNGVG